MNYLPKASSDRSVFDNVFVNPEAYRAFQATGTWPDKTVMLLEARQAQSMSFSVVVSPVALARAGVQHQQRASRHASKPGGMGL